MEDNGKRFVHLEDNGDGTVTGSVRAFVDDETVTFIIPLGFNDILGGFPGLEETAPVLLKDAVIVPDSLAGP